MKHKLIALLISIFLSASSQAATISTSIPSLIGEYEYLNDSRTVSFDLGVRFSSITSASIELTAQGVDGLAQVCNTIITGPFTSIYSCNDYRESPKAFYRLSSENSTESGILVVDSIGSATTSAVLSETDQLLDGKGTLLIDHAQLDFHNYFNLYPFLSISDVSIVIDGVVATNSNPMDCAEEHLNPALDIDGNCIVDALTDGLLTIRYMFGLKDNSLINRATAQNCIRCNSSDVSIVFDGIIATDSKPIDCAEEHLNPALDIDGDCIVDALTDGLLIIRYMFGLKDNSLIDKATAENCTRCNSEGIIIYLDNLSR